MLAGGSIHPGQFGVLLDESVDAVPGHVVSNEENQRATQKGADKGIEEPPPEAEHDAGGKRQQVDGHKQRHAQTVDQHKDQWRPGALLADPCFSLRDVSADQFAGQCEQSQRENSPHGLDDNRADRVRVQLREHGLEFRH